MKASQEASSKLSPVKEESTGGKFVKMPTVGTKDAKKKKTKKARVEIEYEMETEQPIRQKVSRK